MDLEVTIQKTKQIKSERKQTTPMELPNGIAKNKSGYVATYASENLGIFRSVEEAFNAYAKKKETIIRKIATEYIDKIPRKLYDAMINHKVLIKNDNTLS